jgi:hypothetical protein
MIAPPFIAHEGRTKLGLGLLGCIAFVAVSVFL